MQRSGKNLEEFYRRANFNILLGNSDDHFRNHGFLLDRKDWKLYPAYDLNPTSSEFQSLLISRDSDSSDLLLLLEGAEDYFLPQNTARKIISEVVRKFSEKPLLDEAIAFRYRSESGVWNPV